MAQGGPLTSQERSQIEDLIRAFDNHGCSLGLDVRAQRALRRLLVAYDEVLRGTGANDTPTGV